MIEVAPLAFMRGRTLNDSFVILDEAQNTTSEQMKMFLTRLGFDSKAVVTGDITQIDLPPDKPSGLVEASRVLAGVEGIGFCDFTDADVVRHPLVQSDHPRLRARRRAQDASPASDDRCATQRTPARGARLPRFDRALLGARARAALRALGQARAELSLALVDDAAMGS